MDLNIKVAVVSAGPSGLIAAKYVLHHGYKCDVFEQTESLGGNWVYKDCVDIDDNGFEVQSSIYKNMKTNIPKEMMEFSGFRYSQDIRESYIKHNYVLDYYNSYAQHFNLHRYIQYFTRVIRIVPVGKKWIITVYNVKDNYKKSLIYDAIFVCNGRFKYPFTPTIPGQELFCGSQMHSRNYRIPDPYQGQIVLIIGGGLSGQGLVSEISHVARHVFISSRKSTKIMYPSNVTQEPEVVKFTTNSVIFCDGTTKKIDAVFYCTGYLYKCTFLTEKCGVKLECNGVVPLYKQIINIEYPSMYFIGLPNQNGNSVVFELQVRFAIAALRKQFILPSKEHMLGEWKNFVKIKVNENVPLRYLFRLNNCKEMKAYCEDLATTASIANIPLVFFKIFDSVVKCNRRHYLYRVINDETFEEYSLS